MKRLSHRRAFTGLMSILATAFVIGIWRQRFSWQSDFKVDLLKVSVCVAASTALVSYVVWSLTHFKETPSKGRAYIYGALAGGLTAIIIIPLPYFAWSFKTEFLIQYRMGDIEFLRSSFGATLIAIENGLKTYASMTKASVVAVLGSCLVGAGITHYYGDQTSDA